MLNCPQRDTEDDHPFLRKEVKAAVQSLKKGKSAGVDNIPAKLVQASREVIITALTTIYRATSHTSRPSKLILKIILNRLKPQSEKIMAEEQAGLTAKRSTTEQIFNLRILCDRYLQHQQELYHVFIDFKNAFVRVWHAALWATIKKYNISTNLIRIIKNLHGKVTRAVFFNSIVDWLRKKTQKKNSWSPTGMSTLIRPLQHIS